MKDIAEKFWTDYRKADYIKREKMIIRLAIYKTLFNYYFNKFKSKEGAKIYAITEIRAYFDDACDYL